MTAEIAILNKTAIALAADSKVTLSFAGRQKTYDTVDKLFSLSKTEPIGAMIYGSAEFMGFPWETIIKEYRRRSPRKKFDTVFDWADDLLKFLGSFFPFTPEDNLRVAKMIGESALEQIVQRYFQFIRANMKPDDILEQLRGEVLLHITDLEGESDFMSEAEWEALGAPYQDLVGTLSTTGFAEGFPDLHESLKRLVTLSIRKSLPSPSHSGLVVAGFGEKELLPSIISFEIDGIVGGKLKCREANKFDATRRSHGFIVPFAQVDMVHRFMEGVDPDYAVQLQSTVEQLLIQNTIDTARALGHGDDEITKMVPAFEKATAASLIAFWETDKSLRRERFSQPIIDMVMSLPKDELAHLAEALVSLTSLQRRVSREIETVGGALDVAVISKGDGFVWVKRKHYFSPDRNLRFVNGYFSEYATPNLNGENDGNP